MNKAKTDTRDKAGTKPIAIPKAEDKDAKNGNIPTKPKKWGKEDITERATIHKVRTEDKGEAIEKGNRCKTKTLIVMDREGKIKDNEWSKTEVEWSKTEVEWSKTRGQEGGQRQEQGAGAQGHKGRGQHPGRPRGVQKAR